MKNKLPKVLGIMICGYDIDGQSLYTFVHQDYPNIENIIRAERPKELDKEPVKNLYLNCAANRENAREIALKTDADYFFFIDSDIILPRETVISEMMKQIHIVSPAKVLNPTTGKTVTIKPANRKKHIIAGWYRTNSPHRYVAGKWIGNNKFSNFASVQRSLVETHMVGLGCALISREALSKLHFRAGIESFADNIPSCGCKDCKEIPNAMLGECLDFGNQAASHGYKMFMDGAVVCGHVKFRERDGKRERIILT